MVHGPQGQLPCHAQAVACVQQVAGLTQAPPGRSRASAKLRHLRLAWPVQHKPSPAPLTQHKRCLNRILHAPSAARPRQPDHASLPVGSGQAAICLHGFPCQALPALKAWPVLQVSLLYTAPTAIRSLMAKGDSFVTKHSRKSLRVLGTVGEPINPAGQPAALLPAWLMPPC